MALDIVSLQKIYLVQRNSFAYMVNDFQAKMQSGWGNDKLAKRISVLGVIIPVLDYQFTLPSAQQSQTYIIGLSQFVTYLLDTYFKLGLVSSYPFQVLPATNPTIVVNSNNTAGTATTLTIHNPNGLNLATIGLQYLSNAGTVLGTAILSATGDFVGVYPVGTVSVTFYIIPSAAGTNGKVTTLIRNTQGINKLSFTQMYTIGGGAFSDVITAFSFNTPPISIPGVNQSVILPSLGVSFAGSGSSTSGGTIASYSWLRVSGPNTPYLTGFNTSTLTVTRFIAGIYVFSLTVIDNFGLSSTAQTTLTANPPTGGKSASINQTVTINVLQSGPSISVPGAQILAAGASGLSLTAAITANINPIAVSTWSQLSGPNGAVLGGPRNLQVYISGLIAGVYVFQMLSEDTLGLISNKTVTVTASAVAVVPAVNAGGNQTLTINTTSVTLTGSASTSDGSTITAYAWTLTSGPNIPTITSASSVSTTVTGLVAGSYIFNLTATSSNGLTGSSSTTVLASQSVAPSVNAGSNQSLVTATTSATLTGTASGNSGATIVSTVWSKVSGPSGDSVGTPNSLTTGITGLSAGTFTYKLTATDSLGVTANSNTVLTIAAAAGATFTTNLNFNAAAQSVPSWLDITAPTGPNRAVYTGSIGNGITLSSVAIANWFWDNGNSAGAGNAAFSGTSTAVPQQVAISAWFTANQGTYNKTLAGAVLLFTGCVVGGTYSMQIYSAIDASYQPSDNFYISVNGGTDQQPNATANTSAVITFSGLIPDSSGRLWVSAGFPTSGKFPIINAIIFSRTA